MLERQIELRAHVPVELVAGVGFALGEQVLGRYRTVNRVAVGTGDIVFGVFRAPDIGAVELLGVASEAPVDNLSRLHDAKGVDDGSNVAGCVHMRLAGTMASLAAGPLRRFLARSGALEVRVLVETVPDLVVFVAVPAPYVAGIFPFGNDNGCVLRPGRDLRRAVFPSRKCQRRRRMARLGRSNLAGQSSHSGHAKQTSFDDKAI